MDSNHHPPEDSGTLTKCFELKIHFDREKSFNHRAHHLYLETDLLEIEREIKRLPATQQI